MKKKVAIKLFEYIFTIWVIITLNFILPRVIPGDPFLVMTSQEQGEVVIRMTEEQMEYYRNLYGLNQPMHKQYVSYIFKLFKGDLGYSFCFNQYVSKIITNRLFWTFFIVLAAMILNTVISVFLGAISALYRDGPVDKSLYFSLIFISELPAFLLGLLLLLTFSAYLQIFPLSGAMTHFVEFNSWWEKALNIMHHAFLPVVSLTIAHLGGMYLLSRNSVITVLQKDYLTTARAKGLSNIRIMFRHVLRNALLPIVTRVFLRLGSLVGGAVLVENVFSYPGLGLLMREAVEARDYPLIQGIFLVVALFVLSANFVADLLYKKLDPRVN